MTGCHLNSEVKEKISVALEDRKIRTFFKDVAQISNESFICDSRD